MLQAVQDWVTYSVVAVAVAVDDSRRDSEMPRVHRRSVAPVVAVEQELDSNSPELQQEPVMVLARTGGLVEPSSSSSVIDTSLVQC